MSAQRSDGDEPKTPRRPDSQQLVRQWALLRLLSDAKEPYSVKQLSEQLGASKATVERDIATLERDFALIDEQVGKQKKVYKIDHKIRALGEPRRFILRALARPNSKHSIVARGLRDDAFDSGRFDPSNRREYIPLLLARKRHERIIE